MPAGVKLAFLVSVMLVLIVITMDMLNSDHHKKVSDVKKTTASDSVLNSGLFQIPRLQIPQTRSSGYILVIHYWEQVTSASRNLQNLQCWAARNQMTVVEPFVTGSYLGVRDPGKLRFSDIYDMNNWTMASNHTLASWDKFIKKAPRNLISVDIRYGATAEEQCNPGLPDFFRQNNFTLVRKVCVYSNRSFTVKELNEEIFGEHNSPSISTVLLNTWRGLGGSRLNLTDIGSCVRPGGEVRSHLYPSQRMIRDVERYVAKYLKTSDYLAVMVRMEKIRKSDLNMTGCFQQTLETWKKMVTDTGSNSTFLAADMGKFGSSTFRKYYIDHLQGQFQDFFKAIYGNSLTMKQWESTFVDVSGIANPVYVSVVQKTLAARAKCLLRVGGGSFQGHAVQLYLDSHGPEERCIYNVCMQS